LDQIPQEPAVAAGRRQRRLLVGRRGKLLRPLSCAYRYERSLILTPDR
jgi:hypothetical protein